MRYLYVKYPNPISYGSKNIALVKVFQNYVKVQDSRSRLLLRNEQYLNVKYQNPILYGSKDIAQVKVFQTRSKFKVTRSKVLVPKERSLHEVSVCEISEPYPLWFKRYSPD
jgi:hypothetical protein